MTTPRQVKRILLVGYGRAGKDAGLEFLSAITGLKNAGTTSLYLAKYVAAELGVTETEAYKARHGSDEMRQIWFRIGQELRKNDPGILLREALEKGDLCGGVRDLEEILFARANRVVDLIVWVQNVRVAMDKTVMFGPEHCDVIVQNNGTLDEYHEKLRRLAAFAGLV
jgi:hypothetical protein